MGEMILILIVRGFRGSAPPPGSTSQSNAGRPAGGKIMNEREERKLRIEALRQIRDARRAEITETNQESILLHRQIAANGEKIEILDGLILHLEQAIRIVEAEEEPQ